MGAHGCDQFKAEYGKHKGDPGQNDAGNQVTIVGNFTNFSLTENFQASIRNPFRASLQSFECGFTTDRLVRLGLLALK